MTRSRHCESKVFCPRTQCPRPRIKPGLLTPESSALTMTDEVTLPPILAMCVLKICKVNNCLVQAKWARAKEKNCRLNKTLTVTTVMPTQHKYIITLFIILFLINRWFLLSCFVVPLSTHVYRCIPANLMLEANLPWTRIPRGGGGGIEIPLGALC